MIESSIKSYSAKKKQPALSRLPPWVWKATSGGETIWLIGCIHLGKEADTAIYPQYLQLVDSGAAIFFETIPGSTKQPDSQRYISRQGYLPKGQTIKDVVSTDSWAEVNLKLSMEPDLFRQISPMVPWFAALTVTSKGYEKIGLEQKYSLESHILRSSVSLRIPVGGLESPIDQFSAIERMPKGDEEKMLIDSIREFQGGARRTSSIHRAWIQGDRGAMQKAILAEPMDSALHRNIIDRRNDVWIGKIIAASQRYRNTIVVVGVEHLISETSNIPAMLRQRGFSVFP